jgi:hypothetical protein
MRVRAAQKCGVQQARYRNIVHEAAASAEQRRVFDPAHWCADPV